MVRNDLQGGSQAPKSITDYLLLKGGKNIYGEPNFRLVLSTNRVTMKGGIWKDWDRNLGVNERGGLIRLQSGLMIPSHYAPTRTVIEVRLCHKYLIPPGWVLERWMPAMFYGGRDEYEYRCVPGTNVPFGGPYPVHGDYEMVHTSGTEELPSITQLQNAIDRSERTKEHHRKEVGQITLERVNAAQEEYEAEERRDKQEMKDYLNNLMAPVWGSSLAAGRIRTVLAEKQGFRSHVGN